MTDADLERLRADNVERRRFSRSLAHKENDCDTIDVLLDEVARLRLELTGQQKGYALLQAGMESVCEDRDALKHRCRELEKAIRTHRDQKADDRCIEDDDRLYEVLGDGVKCDRRVGSKVAMLKNCERFIDRRCEGGGWRSYAELEGLLTEAAEVLRPIADTGRRLCGGREDRDAKDFTESAGYFRRAAALLARLEAKGEQTT